MVTIYLDVLTLIPELIGSYIRYGLWSWISCPFPNFNGCNVQRLGMPWLKLNIGKRGPCRLVMPDFKHEATVENKYII